MIDGRTPALRLVWVNGYGPPQRYVGLHEIWAPHDGRGASHLCDMMVATLRMAAFQPGFRSSYLGWHCDRSQPCECVTTPLGGGSRAGSGAGFSASPLLQGF